MIYSVLAEAGYFPVEELMTFRRLGSPLQGHVIRIGIGAPLDRQYEPPSWG